VLQQETEVHLIRWHLQAPPDGMTIIIITGR